MDAQELVVGLRRRLRLQFGGDDVEHRFEMLGYAEPLQHRAGMVGRAVGQNQGATINSFLSQTAQLTSALADRDELIGQVITNLNTVLGSLSAQSGKFDEAVTSLSQLVEGLAARKTDISNSVAHSNAAAASVADLMQRIRPPFANTVTQSDRANGIVVADHDYVDNLFATLPDAYKVLGRQGLYGDFFSFYLCDLVLKVNGKGGQPVYIKVAGQDSGRCTPQ